MTPKYAFISGVAQGDPSYVVAAAQINLYSSGGKIPVITIDPTSATLSNGQCTLSGYFVTL